MFDDWQSILWVVGFILGAYGVVLWLGTIVWAYRDICERTRDGWSQAVAVLLVALLIPGFPIPGLLLYLVLRPHETLAEAYERRLEAEALKQEMTEQRRSCPSCQRPAREEFLFCPHCRTKLQEPCSDCGRALDLNWIACPYCGAQGPQPALAATAEPLAVEPYTPHAFQPSAQTAATPPAPPPATPSEPGTSEEPAATAEPGVSSSSSARRKGTRPSPPSPQAGPPP